jgi:very-short-patch-repair endonuclease
MDQQRRRPGAQRWQAPSELWQKLKPLAREMRTLPTAAEDALWQRLRGRGAGGMKFRRQHAIERFVVDFYCSEARLVIEVDGEIHEYTREQDGARQEFLEQQGLRVVRFSNDEVRDNIRGVLSTIEAHASSTERRSPLSAGRRGAGGEVATRDAPALTTAHRVRRQAGSRADP